MKNLFDSAAIISAFYFSDSEKSECDPHEAAAAGDELTFEVFCFDGFTDFNLFVYFEDDGSETEKCAECEAPSIDSETSVGCYLSLDCRDVCKGKEWMPGSL